jgi:Na+/melibiose symporter-like transporter
MDYKSYTTIIFLITVVPAILVIIICLNVWRRYPKSEELMLIIMKGIISRKNIDSFWEVSM